MVYLLETLFYFIEFSIEKQLSDTADNYTLEFH